MAFEFARTIKALYFEVVWVDNCASRHGDLLASAKTHDGPVQEALAKLKHKYSIHRLPSHAVRLIRAELVVKSVNILSYCLQM